MNTQKSSEPFWPPHSAATVYWSGSVLDEYAATYSSVKSCVQQRVQQDRRPRATTSPKTA